VSDLFDLDDPKPDVWDPPAHERQYFRNASSGDLGWLVRRDGQDCIKRDIASNDTFVPYREGQWRPEFRPYPLTTTQMAMVAFCADKELCRFLGLQSKSKMDWAALTDSERSQWINEGPNNPDRRAVLYQSIMDGLKGCEV
jgi:hypothetical protein